jgi:DNA-binding transcriptional ArsR family regulator
MPVRSKDSAVDRLFAALANPTRRDILDLLLSGEHTAGAIAQHFDMARPSVSEHLRLLVECELLTERAEGRQVFYAATGSPLLAVRDWLTPHERFWRERMTAIGGVLDVLAEHEQRDTP